MYRNIIRHVKYIFGNGFVKMSQVNGVNNYSNNASSNESFDLEANRLVWIDMEMTGLDVETNHIMEVACIITDNDLNVIAQSPDIIIHHPESVLNNMNDWCVKQHKKTGLTEACLKSTTSTREAEDILLGFVSKYVTEKLSPLAGNSVYMDRLFLKKYMPKLEDYLHYRIVDVSTMKELCRRWNLSIYKTAPKKDYSHRASGDIRESIEELKFYKDFFLKTAPKYKEIKKKFNV